MSPRPTRDRTLMDMALIVARRSTCQRIPGGIGALIAVDSRVISTGYAGPVSGALECCPEVCNASVPCTRTVHAEANAIIFAARSGIAIEGSTMYCTLSPCESCAKMIVNAGIARVLYASEYRSAGGITLLVNSGVDTLFFPDDMP